MNNYVKEEVSSLLLEVSGWLVPLSIYIFIHLLLSDGTVDVHFIHVHVWSYFESSYAHGFNNLVAVCSRG